jgi:uncharacterized protein YndB with AHSA1/START domain/predicted enzyme related to lactoylglutathione lyase
MTDTKTAAAPTLEIRRRFNAPRDRVFAAWTTGELLRSWFGPPGTTMHEATFDPREGGSYRLAMTASNGEPFVALGTVTEFRRPERLAFTFRWQEDDPAQEHGTSITIDLHAVDDRTEMVFTHTGFVDDASRDRHDEGWSGSFDRMNDVVVKAPPLAIRGIDLNGYMCKDGDRAIAFYRDLFGLEPAMVYPDGRGGEFELPDGSTFGLWGGGDKVMPFQPSNGILFAVDDLQAAIATVTARGLAVHYQTETPNCTMAMINDSEGNILTLHQRKG